MRRLRHHHDGQNPLSFVPIQYHIRIGQDEINIHLVEQIVLYLWGICTDCPVKIINKYTRNVFLILFYSLSISSSTNLFTQWTTIFRNLIFETLTIIWNLKNVRCQFKLMIWKLNHWSLDQQIFKLKYFRNVKTMTVKKNENFIELDLVVMEIEMAKCQRINWNNIKEIRVDQNQNEN